ncbi:hypothetical protein [Sulfurospirillum barnesii]|uniref:Uncharacterized protein n=1 Tax=Sulfurospirillum barnesii (strain ATCC 700032 / DSM 10660 / SES-3) TaxID=760154 RepID=I3XY64_SULBS|nr:hypothetical protein [Sulfurospirillum barnesii]AFL68888.1 hypothetical protein Sulba_1600 [Sulfurospirillum barnesii SES-3]
MAIINTGEPRNVVGNAISGALASGMVASALNYNQYKQEKIDKETAIKNSLKLTVQGGIVTASAIAAANYVGNNNILGVLTAVSLGAMGVYGVEKVYEKTLTCKTEDVLDVKEEGE